jgi:hypothetical protein
MRVNDKVYTGLTPAKVEKLIQDLRGDIKWWKWK